VNISFNDLSLLQQALIHSSYANENPELASESNERLEFLGDAVLDLVVAERLYRDFPHFTEGEMTKLRAALVCQDTLSLIARDIRLSDYLYLGKGEEASGGRNKPANLADVLEAVIGAIFLDQGLVAASSFTLGLFDEEFVEEVSQKTCIDYKSRLQEIIQSRGQPVPEYRVVATTGSDHDRRFTVEVTANGTVLGRGSGKSKKAAEAEAARSALEKSKE